MKFHVDNSSFCDMIEDQEYLAKEAWTSKQVLKEIMNTDWICIF